MQDFKVLLMAITVTVSMLFIPKAEPSDIVLSKSIKPKMREKIVVDLKRLEEFNFKDPNPEVLKLMKLSDLSSQSVLGWLEERVKYLIEENALSVIKMVMKKIVYVERENVVYPNNTILPFTLNTNLDLIGAEDEGVTIMSNTGAGLYLAGKEEHKLYGMKISQGLFRGPLKILIESPRVGIIQIGEGLFSRSMLINSDDPNAVSNSIIRLTTFFHEARHSDGAGISLAFAHSKCPIGHDLEGVYACDENLNGPYAIGGYMNLELIKACDDQCTLREKEMLKIDALDSFNRILKKTNLTKKPTTHWNDDPESL